MIILYVLLAIVILLLMVVIHEFGHYVAGKLLKFKINEFSVGFGPKIFSKKKKNGEVFSLRLVPLGGFCAFEGESEPSEDTSVRSFVDEKPWKRIIVLIAGGVFNLLSAVIFSFLFIAIVGHATPTVTRVYASDIEGTKPYCQLAPNDKITHVNGKKINIIHSYDDYTADLKIDEEVTLTVVRDGKPQNVKLTLQTVEVRVYKKDEKRVVNCEVCGTENRITLTEGQVVKTFECNKCKSALPLSVETEQKTYPGFGFESMLVYENHSIGDAFVYCVPFTAKLSWTILGSFFQLFTGKVPITAISGPIGTVSMMAQVAKLDWRNVFILLPLIASNLGLFNLLPIPALDGSKVIFTIIEWIRRKPINRKVEGYIHTIGIIVLMAFVVIVDIVNLILKFV